MKLLRSKAVFMCGAAIAALMGSAEARAEERAFDVPASDAVKSIPEFARQAGIQILVPADRLKGLRTPQVKGTWDVHAALSALIAGTHFSIAADDGKTIVLAAPKAMAANLARPLPAQAGPDASAAAAPNVEEVVVTGSLIRGATAVGAPVNTLDATNFLQTGALTTTDVLKDLPAVFINPAETNQATFNNLGKTNPINIHRVGPAETLLMVDGMRTAPTGRARFTDPSTIPAIAVDHIDVLADGASATYGSDAVAGVVNVILKRNFDGAVSQGHVTFYDDKFDWQVSQLFGRTWNGGDVAVSFDYYNQGALHASDRPDLYTFNLTGVGFKDYTLVASSYPATLTTGTAASYLNGVGGPCSNCYASPTGLGPNSVVNFATLTAGTRNEVQNVFEHGDLLPHDTRTSETLVFDQDITKDIQLFAEGYYSNRRSLEFYTPGYPPGTNNQVANLVLPSGYPYLTAGFPTNLHANYDFAPIINPYISSSEVTDHWSAGFNVKLPFDWTGKIFYAATEDRLFVGQENQINTNNLSALLGNTVTATVSGTPSQVITYTKPATLATFNVFCDPTKFSCLNADQIAYIRGYATELDDYLRHEANVTFNGPLFSLPGGEVRLAVGGDYYKDNYIMPQSITSTGPSVQIPVASTVANGTALFNSREVYAGFGELNVPLFGEGNAMPGIQKLVLQLSGRYDHYSDFGKTSNPKIGLNWVPFDGLTLRGSWGTSFRAPTLLDTSNSGRSISGDTSATTQTTTPNCAPGASQPTPGSSGAILLAAIGGTCASNPFSPSLNDKGGAGGLAGLLRPVGSSLGPETSKTWTLGGEFAPPQIPGLDLDATYWDLKIQKVLGIVGGTDRMYNPNLAFSNLVFGQPGFDNALTTLLNSGSSLVPYSAANAAHLLVITDGSTNNLGSYEQTGLDFKIHYVLPIDMFGTWNAGVTGSYIFHEYYAPAPGGKATDISNTLTNGPENIGSLRMRFRANLGWTADNGLNVNAYANYQNSYKNTQGVIFPANGRVPSFTTYDLSVGYSLGDQPANDYLKQINFQLVVNNIFAFRPPIVVDTAQGTTTYDGTNFSPLGRMISFTVTKTW